MDWEVPLSKYKNRILNIAVIILALFVAGKIYKSQNKRIESLKKNKDMEMKRNEVLGNIIQLDKRIKAYKNFLNKKDISLAIDNISNIAEDSNIKINFIRPDAEQAYPMYIKYGFNLGISASDYQALGKFINRLENSDDVYIIDTLNIGPEFESEYGRIKGLNVIMKINTFLFEDKGRE